MLGGFRLQLAGRRNEGHQREVDVDDIAPWQLIAQLTDRLKERQPLNIADGAADLHQHEVESLGPIEDELLDGIGDMRDDLDGGAEVVATPFLGENVPIDASCCDV